LIRNPISRSLVPLACLAAFVAYGCATPFGPGYIVQKQRIVVTYSQQSPDRLSVRASYFLKNNGIRPLDSLELGPPDPEIIQPQAIRVEWRGKTVEIPSSAFDPVANEIRVPFEKNWATGESGNFVVSYDVKISPDKAAAGTNPGAAFFLPSSGWLPNLLPPHGVLAVGGTPPAKWDLVVGVPEGYRVRASGTNLGPEKHGATKSEKGAGLRFEQRPGTNYDPYVAAGPFVEQPFRSGGGTVLFWTTSPLAQARLGELGKKIATDAEFFSKEFGANDPKSPVWLIECPEGTPISRDRPWVSQTGCLTQPRSVVVPTEYFAAAAPEQFMKYVDLQLAATWLYFSVRPRRYGSLFPMTAIPDYAGVALGASRNPDLRNETIRELLQRVDSIPDEGKPLVRVDANDSRELQERARAESVLFFFALEDRCGAHNVRKGIAHASRVLRGQTWGLPELKSAVEAECGGPVLDDFFREWMHGYKIPPAFREKYGTAVK
jgi:hypothetical protein